MALFTPEELQAIRSRGIPRAQSNVGIGPQAPKKSFWMDQISTVGGIGGGILGSLIAPIAGTAGGAAAGSALGEALENALTGDSLGKNVVKEGALGAVFGAGPLKLAKGAVGGTKALLTGADDIVGAASKAAQTSWLKNVGGKTSRAMLGDAWGTKAGSKVDGEILSPQEATRLNSFITKVLGVKNTANADDVLGKAFEIKDSTGKAIGTIISANNRQLTTKESLSITKQVADSLSKIAGVDLKTNPRAMKLVEQVQAATSLDDLHKLRISIDDGINFGRSSGAADPVYEQIAKQVRTKIDRFVKDAIPDLAPMQKTYSGANKVIEVVAPSARNPRGLNIFNNKVGGPQAQRAKAGLGNMLSSVGQGGAQTKKGIVGRLGTTGLLTGAANQAPSGEMDSQSWPNMNTMSENSMSPNSIQPNIMSESYNNLSTSASTSPFAPQNIEANIQKITQAGGDLSDVMEYLKIAQAVNELTTSQQTTAKPLNQAQQERADLVNALGMTEDVVNQGSINFGPIGSRVEGFKSMFNQADPETLTYKNTVSGLRAAITKARAGASLTEGELRLLEKYTPSDTDSEQVVRSKLAQLKALYGGTAPTQGASTLEDALMQYQY